MTDNEIIKALECCCKNNNCEGCPLDYLTFSSQCASELAIKSLDLINRLQAENKRLGKEVDLVSIQFQDLQERYEESQAEIERFRKTEIEIDDFCRRLCRMRMLNGNAMTSYEDLQNYIQQEKSEAVKEFAKRLKNKIKTKCNPYGKPTFDYDTSVAIMCYIDNLVKEMVGDDK